MRQAAEARVERRQQARRLRVERLALALLGRLVVRVLALGRRRLALAPRVADDVAAAARVGRVLRARLRVGRERRARPSPSHARQRA